MKNCLILNSDAAPVSMLPLSIISWQDAIGYIVSDKAVVLEWYADSVVRSARWSTPVPAVMMLREYKKKKGVVRFSKQNVFLRDNFKCQYCYNAVTEKTATLDHVLPRHYGGKSTWENSTTSCGPCNSKKGDNRAIVPKIKPTRPNYYALVENRKKLAWHLEHPSWVDYLGVDN